MDRSEAGGTPASFSIKPESDMLITSQDNRRVRQALSLNARKHRDTTGLYLVEGPNLIREALQQNVILHSLFFMSEDALPRMRIEELDAVRKIAEAGENPPEIRFLGRDIFQKIAQTQTPQGVLAIAEKSLYAEQDFFTPAGGNVLVLDRIQDPGNLGTLLRTAEAAGFSGAMLLKGCGDVYGPKAVRAAAGTLFRLPLLFPDTPQLAAGMLRINGKTIYAAAAGGNTPYYDCPFNEDAAIVIGNEGNGVSAEWLEAADCVLSIPMAGRAESLNAALAGGIIMYEAFRQRLVRTHQ